MSRREFASGEPELMDRPDASAAELAAALRSLRALNRWFGSHRMVEKFLRRWLRPGDRWRVADLATGSADIPRLVADFARQVGAEVEIVAVDFQPRTLATAQALSGDYPEITCEQADVLTFGAKGSFDLVICSLALHHFSDEDAVALLRRCREISRHFVLVTDLRRGWLAHVGVYLLTALIFRDRMTREDGRVSAARAFSFAELRALAEKAGWRKFWRGEIPLGAPGDLAGEDLSMQIIETVKEAHAYAAQSRARRVLVPTMGALHRGHAELLRLGRELAGADGELAASIFVNPLQFEPGSDFERYPRPQEADEELCRAAGVDVLFRPRPGEMYLDERSAYVEETALSLVLEGASRPGHFRGVCTVVAKLFHLLGPHAAVFGEKDWQQLAIIRRMVRDLDFPIEIIGAPTVREADGLACSSRNKYLSAEERAQAPVLRIALMEAAASGEKIADNLIAKIRSRIETQPAARIDYVAVVDAETLAPRSRVEANSLLALAVRFGQTRLIDNLRLP